MEGLKEKERSHDEGVKNLKELYHDEGVKGSIKKQNLKPNKG